MFAAKTTQSKVAGVKIEQCVGKRKDKVCTTREEKWSYAIPLEIIYLTPLTRWNPYKIPYEEGKCTETGKHVPVAKRKTGNCKGMNKNDAFTKICRRNYYLTPSEFFSHSEETNVDAADSTKDVLCFLDPHGTIRKLKASGTRILLPGIEGLGRMRTRWPIAPCHQDGSATAKEFEALKDIVMNPKTYDFMEYTDENGDSDKDGGTTDPNKLLQFEMGESSSKFIPQHTHSFEMLESEAEKLRQDPKARYKVTASHSMGHTHTLLIKYDRKYKNFRYELCEGVKKLCFDGHTRKCDLVE